MKKVALITGSSRGIGKACAETLARRGYAVCINYIERRDKAEELRDALLAEGLEAMCFGADVADRAALATRRWTFWRCSRISSPR